MVEAFTIQSPVLPCSGWNIDPSCCDEWDTYSLELQTNAAQYGAFTVWAATGRRFGLCVNTVRPCGMYCSNPGVYGYYWAEGSWRPYIFNGAWRNCWCGCGTGAGCCGCEPDCQVLLNGPVHSIIDVTVDGTVVDPATYRVDNGQWLVRTHNQSTDDCWPQCQDYNQNSGEGTFIVRYYSGIPVPSVLLNAAGELACEWARSCTGAACRLPGRVQSVARQGVSFSNVNPDDMLKMGLTGVPTVDQVIAMFNPYGLTSRMRIDSPDDEVHRSVTWP